MPAIVDRAVEALGDVVGGERVGGTACGRLRLLGERLEQLSLLAHQFADAVFENPLTE